MIPAYQKGKGKAQDFDESNLDPVMTYRHILSQNLLENPLRVVALCDSDAFYAACEMVRLGVTDKPLVVLQWEGIIAVNYHARKFGITRFHKLKDAKERCPELMIIHVATYKEGEAEPGYWDNVDSRTHKVSLDYYRRESEKILAMFKEGLPDAEIEKASIDEAFIDFTKPVRQILLQRYPYLAQIPPDSSAGADTPLPEPPTIDWDNHSHLVPINPVSADAEAVDDAHKETGPDPITWHDVALQIAAELMHKVRVDIANKLGYTTSAGLARNKFLAKLCASYRKPNSQTILRNQAIPGYLKPLEFQKIRFLGGKLGKALAKEYDVSTVADLLPISQEELQSKFGENALWVYEILRYVGSLSSVLCSCLMVNSGIDRSEVKEKSPVNKSMLAAKALQKPITRVDDGPHWIRVLAAELSLRLNDARRARPSLWPKTIVLNVGNGYETRRSKQAPFPFTKEVNVDVIAAAGGRLWKELVANVSGPIKITLISLGFTGIDTLDESQQSIDGFFANSPGIKRPREDINDISQHEHKVDTPRPKSTKRHRDSTASIGVSFTCSECHKTFSLPAKLQSNTDMNERTLAIEAMKNEHSDFHFAQSVARHVEPEMSKISRKPKQKDNGTKGIEKFFNRTA
ncbi:DNA polymerase eta [Rhodocollybia butyracea]|uniref:DNA polymerase eta n=1 Tax=Rhodocollybia butyracea TaxID=206335 RepID=A0A9P5PLI4_9AGAR|nr:DNA polymerase eta [Rhodocollybia butyracea]